jgi:hypothetical protein
MEAKLCEFITPNGSAFGAFVMDERYRVDIKIETYDKNIFNFLTETDILNGISDNQKCVFARLWHYRKSIITRNGKMLFKVEIASFCYIEGIHCQNLSDIKVISAETSFNYLDKWYKGTMPSVNSLKSKMQAINSNELGDYKFENYNISDGFDIIIGYSTNITDLSEHFNVTFQGSSESILDYFNKINKFARFMSLCCFEAVEINNKITCCIDERNIIEVYRYKHVNEVKVYPQNIIYYQELKSNLEKILRNYYLKTELYPTISTLNSDFYIPNSTVGGTSLKFLNCTMAIDSLYSIKDVCDFSESEGKYKNEIEEYLKCVSDRKAVKFFKDKLNNSYRATFRMKLTQFFENVKGIFISDDKTLSELTTIVKETRNYYTHKGLKSTKVIDDYYLSLVNCVLLSLLVYTLFWFYNDKQHINTKCTFILNNIDSLKELIKDDVKILCEKV